MTTLEIRVPDIGEFESVEVIEILVAAGDSISVEQSLITLESDKTTMEIPCTHAGTITEICVEIGNEVSQGDLIVRVDIVDDAVVDEPPEASTATTSTPERKAPPPSRPNPTPSRHLRRPRNRYRTRILRWIWSCWVRDLGGIPPRSAALISA